MKRFLAAFMVLLSALMLAACGASSSQSAEPEAEEKVDITIGSSCMEIDMVTAIADHMNERGYNVTVVPFDSNSGGADLCSAGDLDSFIYNRQQWLDQYNIDNGTDLEMVNDLYYTRQALYSNKYDSIDAIPEGATIAIPNDATNMNGTLLFLQETGLIKLGEPTDELYTVLDIAENPKNLKFVEAEVSYVARSGEDCDAFVCTATQVYQLGDDPSDFLAEDDSMKDYPIGLTVRAEDAGTQWVADMKDIMASDEFKAEFNELYGGFYVLY